MSITIEYKYTTIHSIEYQLEEGQTEEQAVQMVKDTMEEIECDAAEGIYRDSPFNWQLNADSKEYSVWKDEEAVEDHGKREGWWKELDVAFRRYIRAVANGRSCNDNSINRLRMLLGLTRTDDHLKAVKDDSSKWENFDDGGIS